MNLPKSYVDKKDRKIVFPVMANRQHQSLALVIKNARNATI